MKLRGYYNELKYRVCDIDSGNDIYEAGNSPYDSQGYLTEEDGVGLETMEDYCKSTCENLALENECEFLGIEFEEEDE